MSTPTGRPPEELRELLGAYALDAVDDVERRALERFVATDPEAAAELASFRATAAELGAAAPADVPAGVRAAVLAEVARTPQEDARTGAGTGGSGVVPGSRRARGLAGRPTLSRRVLSLAVAAAAVVAVGVPTVVAFQERTRAVQAEEEGRLLRDVLAEPGAELLRADVEGGGEAVAVLGEDRAVLVAEGLPVLDEDRVYQLWAMRDGTPVPAGLLDVEGGTVQALAQEYRPGDGLAVSVEPAGGSEQPTTTPIVVLVPS